MSRRINVPFLDIKRKCPSDSYEMDTPSERYKTASASSAGSLLHVSPVLQKFVMRFLNTVSASTSSLGSLFQLSTPGSERSADDIAQGHVSPALQRRRRPVVLEFIEFNRDGRPKLPFCEGYDGMNMRNTKTFSESLVHLLESRWEKDESQTKKYHLSKTPEVECMTSAYFARRQVIRDMKQSKFVTRTVSHTFETTDTDRQDLGSSNQNIQKMNRSLIRSKRSLWAEKYKIITVPSQEHYSLLEERGFEEASIDLKIKYISGSETLEVVVIRLEDVTDLKDNNKLINSFVKLSMHKYNGKRKQKTKMAKLCRDPVFNQTFQIENITEKWFHVECLHVELYRAKPFKNTRIGDTFIWLDDLDLFFNETVSITERLNPCF